MQIYQQRHTDSKNMMERYKTTPPARQSQRLKGHYDSNQHSNKRKPLIGQSHYGGKKHPKRPVTRHQEMARQAPTNYFQSDEDPETSQLSRAEFSNRCIELSSQSREKSRIKKVLIHCHPPKVKRGRKRKQQNNEQSKDSVGIEQSQQIVNQSRTESGEMVPQMKRQYSEALEQTQQIKIESQPQELQQIHSEDQRPAIDFMDELLQSHPVHHKQEETEPIKPKNVSFKEEEPEIIPSPQWIPQQPEEDDELKLAIFPERTDNMTDRQIRQQEKQKTNNRHINLARSKLSTSSLNPFFVIIDYRQMFEEKVGMTYQAYKQQYCKNAPNLLRQKASFQIYREKKLNQKIYEEIKSEIDLKLLKEKIAQDRFFYDMLKNGRYVKHKGEKSYHELMGFLRDQNQKKLSKVEQKKKKQELKAMNTVNEHYAFVKKNTNKELDNVNVEEEKRITPQQISQTEKKILSSIKVQQKTASQRQQISKPRQTSLLLKVETNKKPELPLTVSLEQNNEQNELIFDDDQLRICMDDNDTAAPLVFPHQTDKRLNIVEQIQDLNSNSNSQKSSSGSKKPVEKKYNNSQYVQVKVQPEVSKHTTASSPIAPSIQKVVSPGYNSIQIRNTARPPLSLNKDEAKLLAAQRQKQRLSKLVSESRVQPIPASVTVTKQVQKVQQSNEKLRIVKSTKGEEGEQNPSGKEKKKRQEILLRHPDNPFDSIRKQNHCQVWKNLMINQHPPLAPIINEKVSAEDYFSKNQERSGLQIRQNHFFLQTSYARGEKQLGEPEKFWEEIDPLGATSEEVERFLALRRGDLDLEPIQEQPQGNELQEKQQQQYEQPCRIAITSPSNNQKGALKDPNRPKDSQNKKSVKWNEQLVQEGGIQLGRVAENVGEKETPSTAQKAKLQELKEKEKEKDQEMVEEKKPEDSE